MIPIYELNNIDNKIREKIFRRSQADIDSIYEDVKLWIDRIKKEGDKAILDYVLKFDNPDFKIDNIKVSENEIEYAYEKIDKNVLEMIKRQIYISKTFHEKQAENIFKEGEWSIETIKGVKTGVKKTPIDSAGLYVPAGKAPLPTVAQILTVAAKAAGVPRICVFFPPTAENLEIIVAANEAGANEIYRVGGIVAVAAMAYGTESIKRVEKIAGPGSPFVQAAKLQVFGQVGIDMLSGPSEALIMADQTARADFIASDILARCEHGPDSACPVITNDKDLAKGILYELEKQKNKRSRFEKYISKAFQNGYNGIFISNTENEMVNFANDYAAEHLHIQMNNSEKIAEKIRNAGSIFIGEYSPVPIGDYASGTNHALPTARAVKFSSPVGVETFIKSNEFQYLTKEGLKQLQPIISTISKVEGLDGHCEAVDIRLRDYL